MIRQTLTQNELDGMIAAMAELDCTSVVSEVSGTFDLQSPDGYDSDEPDSLGDLDTNEFIDDSRDEMDDYYEDDGQPTEYDEWQDVYGGDDWDHGQYEQDPAEYEWDCDLHNEW